MAKSFARTEVHGTVRNVKIKDLGKSKVLEFSIPYSESYKDSKTNEWKSTPTVWYNMQIWGNDDNAWFRSSVKNIVEGAFIIVTDALRKDDNYENNKGEITTSVRYKVNKYHIVKGEVENQPTAGGKAAKSDAPF